MTNNIRLPDENSVTLIGRLTRDPELRYTPKGQPVCNFDLAVNRRYRDSSGQWQEETSFIPVVTWAQVAERCAERAKKGKPLQVVGRLRSRSWETKEGQKRTVLEVVAFRVQFLERSETGDTGAGPTEVNVVSSAEGTEEKKEVVPSSATTEVGEDDVPF